MIRASLSRDLQEAVDFHRAVLAEGSKALVGYDTAKAVANVVLLSEIPTTYDKRSERQVNAGNLLLRGVPGVGKTFFGVILSAAYALWLYRKVVFGALTKPSLASIKDLTVREGLTLAPLVFLTILFGVYPKPVLDMSAASVQQLVNNYNTAITAVKAAALLQ